MSSKPIEEYTDKELENAINLHETELRKDKNDFVMRKNYLSETEINQLQEAIMQKEEWLKKLLNERKRRIEYDKENIV